MTYGRLQNIVIGVFIAIMVILIAISAFEHHSKDKLRCYICNDILWRKQDEWQFRDLWLCEECWRSAEGAALDITEGRFVLDGEPGRVVEGKLYDIMYKIVLERRTQ